MILYRLKKKVWDHDPLFQPWVTTLFSTDEVALNFFPSHNGKLYLMKPFSNFLSNR